MHTILLVFGAALAGSAALAGLVLLVPLQVTARGVCTAAEVDAMALVSWGAGIACVTATPRAGVQVHLLGWPVYRVRMSSTSESPPPEPEDAVEAPQRPSGRRRRPTLRQMMRFGARTLRRIGPTLKLRAQLSGRVGTGDPADTAAVYGALVATRAWLPGIDTTELRVDWVEPAIDLEGQLAGRVWPAAIVWIVSSEFIRMRWPGHRRGGSHGRYREAV